MYSVGGTAALPAVGFRIRTSSDQSLVSGSPGLFAATPVLLRLLSPRHPSCALCSLVFSLLRPSLWTPKSKTRVQRGAVNRLAFSHNTLCLLANMQFSKSAGVPPVPQNRIENPRNSEDCVSPFDLVCSCPCGQRSSLERRGSSRRFPYGYLVT